MKNKLAQLDTGTIFRTIALVVTAINQVVAVIGRTTFASAEWYQWLSLAALIATALVAWWENNDITQAAQLGTKVVNALEDGKITPDEIQDVLDKNTNE